MDHAAIVRRLDWEGDVIAVNDSASDQEVDEANSKCPHGSVRGNHGHGPRGEFTYEADDHTAAAPARRFHNPTASTRRQARNTSRSADDHHGAGESDGTIRRKVVVLPPSLPSLTGVPRGSAGGGNDEASAGTARPTSSSTSTSTMPSSLVGTAPPSEATCARRREAVHSLHPSPPSPSGPAAAAAGAGGGGGASVVPYPSLPYVLVRLPHPRHGEPNLYLCARRSPAEVAALASHRAVKGAMKASLNAHLWELQSQGPPGGYAQTWFLTYPQGEGDAAVVEEVLPCKHTLLSTPVHLTFVALHALVAVTDTTTVATVAGVEGGEGRFMSAEDLFSTDSHMGQQSRHSNRSGKQSAFRDDYGESFDFGESADPLVGDDDEQQQQQTHKARRFEGGDGAAASAAKGTDWGWLDWPAAVRACPALLACWHGLTSHDCLEPLCDVKEVGGTCYYRFARAKAVAWVVRRVRATQRSQALRRVLQLEGSPAPGSPSSSPSSEVPVAVAWGVVSEYVPTVLAADVTAACGMESAKAASASHSALGGPPVGPSSTSTTTATSTPAAAPQASLKSASVKRLEKAGRPKGTPTLFAMFAKKPPA